MSNLIFLRHSKLSLPYRDHGEMPFSVLSDLGLELLNPPIDSAYTTSRIAELDSKIDFFGVQEICASPSPRCQETSAALLEFCSTKGHTPKFKTSPLLKEVHFDLASLDSDGSVQAGIHEHGIATVNTAVFKGMLAGIHCEPIKETYERVEEIFKTLSSDTDVKVFLSHDFFMRVIEIYIRRKGARFSEISLDEIEHTKRNTYLSGFVTNQDLIEFTPIP
jgi:broad specificity phosphatase PhoE